MRDDIINWYKPSDVKISKLTDEEVEEFKRKRMEINKETIAKNKILKSDIDGYTYSVSEKTRKRIKR